MKGMHRQPSELPPELERTRAGAWVLMVLVLTMTSLLS